MSEKYHVTDQECPKHQDVDLWFVPISVFTLNDEIQNLIDEWQEMEDEYQQDVCVAVDFIRDLKELLKGDKNE